MDVTNLVIDEFVSKLLTSNVARHFNIHFRKTHSVIIRTTITLIQFARTYFLCQKIWLTNCREISTCIFYGWFSFWAGVLGEGFWLTFVDVSLQSSTICVLNVNCVVCEGMSEGQPLVCFDKIYWCAYDTLRATCYF